MLRIYFLIFCIIITLTTIYSIEGFESAPARTQDPRCYINGKTIGTPYTFGSGYKGFTYTYEECTQLGGLFKPTPSLPNGQGICYSHDTKLGDSDSYNVLCGDITRPPHVQGDQRCYVNGIDMEYVKIGYLSTNKNKEMVRMYNKRECDMLKGKHYPTDKKNGTCIVKEGDINDGIVTNNFSLFCNQ